jgi:hypothetical protein
LTVREGRRFGLELGLAWLAVAAVAGWRGHRPVALAAAALGTAIALAGLAAPTALGPVRRVWMGAAHAISRVTTPIVLGVLYFGVITPFGWLLRLAGRRPLTEGRTDATAWLPRRPRSDLERQF